MRTIPTSAIKNYTSDTNLLKRKEFIKYCRPKVDLVKNIVKLLNLKGVESILDIGCGNGDVLIELRKKYKHKGELYGIDISKGMIQKAKRSNQIEKTNIKFFQGDAKKLKFHKESFDTAILKHVLHSVVPDHEKVLQECRRILKNDGKLAIALNSRKTRVLFRSLKPRIAEILGLDFFPDSDLVVNLETMGKSLKGLFKDFRIFKFQSEVRMRNPKPYLDYIDSTKELWKKADDYKWRKVLNFSKKYLKEILEAKGEIKDYVTIGIVIATK